jgi:membrane associated rhomboid family serine protease
LSFGTYDGAGAYFQPGSDLPKPIVVLLVTHVVAYVLTMIPGAREFCAHWLYLDTSVFLPWQMVTYMFFHGDVGHLFFNSLSLFFVGPSVARQFNSHRFEGDHFFTFYFTCGIGAALLSYVMGVFMPMGLVLGASGALYGLFFACYKFYPDAVVQVFFVFPMKLKYLLLLLAGYDVLKILDPSSGVAHAAHLGGLVSGIAWFRYSDSFLILRDRFERKREMRVEKDRVHVKTEVDRLLEKISRDGMGALSKKEKKFLSDASRRFKK